MKNPSLDHLFRYARTISNLEYINESGMFMLQNYQMALCGVLKAKPLYKLFSYKNRRMRHNRHNVSEVLDYLDNLERAVIKLNKEIPYTNERQGKSLESDLDLCERT